MKPVVLASLALATVAMLPPECRWPVSIFRPAACETENLPDNQAITGQTANNPNIPGDSDAEVSSLGKANSGNGNGSEGSPLDPDPGNSAGRNNGGD